jgi:hypothetical protein
MNFPASKYVVKKVKLFSYNNEVLFCTVPGTVLCGQDLGLDLSDSEVERKDIDIVSDVLYRIVLFCVQDLGLDLSDSEDERRDIDIDSEGEDSRLSAGEDSRSLLLAALFSRLADTDPDPAF